MSNLLSVEFLIEVHDRVLENSNAEPGILNVGLLSSIVEAPDESFQGSTIHQTIYIKAAVLMERIIRLHPFVDGNKRTSLFAMVEFLQQNGFTILLPLDAVRKTVSIAEYKKLDSKSNERLINEIGEWIKKHSQSNNAHSLQKILLLIRWMLKPFILTALIKLGMIRSARKRLEFWLAYDIHPEYRDMESSIFGLLSKSVQKNLQTLLSFFPRRR